MKRMWYLSLSILLGASLALAGTVISVYSGNISNLGQNTGTVGNQADPWIITEDLGVGGGMLALTSDIGQAVGRGNQTGSGHSTGRWFRKSITNLTADPWSFFELELRENPLIPSGDGDGLSFAQGAGLTFWSDLFAVYTRIDLERDYLNFSQGTVNPGATVTLWFAVTDNSPTSPIYLAQYPNKPDIPEPGTLMLLGTGLVLVALGRFRRAKA